MTGSYRQSSRETEALRLAHERERYGSFWRKAAGIDQRIRVSGIVAVVAFWVWVACPPLSLFVTLTTIVVMTVAAGFAAVHQRRLRRLRCPRCGELYFGAITNRAVAKACVHCRLPRGELDGSR